jgi:hypothetical protein
MRNLILFSAWLLWLLLAGSTMLQTHWELALLVFAALLLVPQGLALLERPVSVMYWLVVAGFSIAALIPPHPLSPWLSMPYVGYIVVEVYQEFRRGYAGTKSRNLWLLSLLALVYWLTGAIWAFCYFTEIRPFGFDLVIVALTTNHFHLAGFVLTVLIRQLYSEQAGRLNGALVVGAILGMPLVAAGITLTKFGYSPVLEWAAALGFALMAFAVLIQHIRLAFNPEYTLIVRMLWLSGSLFLLAGATLATLYALRFEYPISWVNIPNMKWWHGSLNTLGFGWLTLSGWRLKGGQGNGSRLIGIPKYPQFKRLF